MNKLNYFSVLFLVSLLCSCSLKYNNSKSSTAEVPELEFKNPTYTHYNNKVKETVFSATKLEQYKDNDSSYASNAVFSTWDKDGSLSTEGSCSLIEINSKNKIYKLFSNIKIKNHDQNFSLSADSLRYNEKSKQLSSGKTETVFIQQDECEIQGQGFSASSISNTYSFEGAVQGTLTTDE